MLSQTLSLSNINIYIGLLWYRHNELETIKWVCLNTITPFQTNTMVKYIEIICFTSSNMIHSYSLTVSWDCLRNSVDSQHAQCARLSSQRGWKCCEIHVNTKFKIILGEMLRLNDCRKAYLRITLENVCGCASVSHTDYSHGISISLAFHFQDHALFGCDSHLYIFGFFVRRCWHGCSEYNVFHPPLGQNEPFDKRKEEKTHVISGSCTADHNRTVL